MGGGQHSGDDQGPDECPDLVERLVDCETLAPTGCRGRVGQQGVLGGRANGLADAFEDHQ
jgi:hypothetical protein